jgi:hypothetical protein
VGVLGDDREAGKNSKRAFGETPRRTSGREKTAVLLARMSASASECSEVFCEEKGLINYSYNEGSYISFHDDSGQGTKAISDMIVPSEYIRLKHIAMVGPGNVEVEELDDVMQNWIGSLEEYYFFPDGEESTRLEMMLTLDEGFQEMFDGTWPQALGYLKEICES